MVQQREKPRIFGTLAERKVKKKKMVVRRECGRCTDQTAEEGDEIIVMSPTKPIAKSESGKVLARLIGDFHGFQDSPDLNDKYLLIPKQENFTQEINNWLVVSPHEITFDGGDCDKV